VTANNNGHSHASSTNNAPSPYNAEPPTEVILITGAGGSIGSSITRQLLRAQRCLALSLEGCAPTWQDVIRPVVLLDHSEQNLYEIQSELSSANATAPRQIVPVLGDVNDASLLDELFEKYRPTQIFHAAAFKHVPLMEENPIAVIRNNILGTWTLAAAALKHRTRQLVMISTDKAANPRSIMGAAKRVAELVLARLDSPATRMRSVRLGNVLGSTGSVVPLFQRQIENGGPVTVTHPDARRYFMSLDEATNLILAVAALDDPATLFVPELDAPIKIFDLAKKMIRESAESVARNTKPIEIVFTGLRPGDKLSEDLLSSSETAEPTSHPKLRRICGPLPPAKSLDSAINLISEKVQARDLPALLDAIRALVPDYQPSDTVRSSANFYVAAKA
jgi:FlaA1/EpsC-like NDP-sugar epimerase